jgi:hypothetical protein
MPGAMYEVEKIIGKRFINGKAMYRVKWKDYGVEESTWEAVSHLRYVQELIDEFELED